MIEQRHLSYGPNLGERDKKFEMKAKKQRLKAFRVIGRVKKNVFFCEQPRKSSLVSEVKRNVALLKDCNEDLNCAFCRKAKIEDMSHTAAKDYKQHGERSK